MDQILGFGDDLLQLLEILDISTLADKVPLFCTAISKLFSLTINTCIYTSIMAKNKVMNRCISVSLQPYII